MPAHDWTRVGAGLFHNFHQMWSVQLTNYLNSHLMPPGYFALVEQRTGGSEPDLIAVEIENAPPSGQSAFSSTITRPKTQLIQRFETENERYARRANRISIRHQLGEVVAVIEIVSPGNKSSRHAIRSFVQKTVEFLESGIHVVVIDLFPPMPRDPNGIHDAIAGALGDDSIPLPEDKPLTLVGYDATQPVTDYIEPFAVGDVLRDVPLFLNSETFVSLPIERTYLETWELTPRPIRDLVVKQA